MIYSFVGFEENVYGKVWSHVSIYDNKYALINILSRK